MLVLTRKYQEKVHIGDGITITILRTKGKAVRLGIEAPAEVPVIRGELTFNESAAASLQKVASCASATDIGVRQAMRTTRQAHGSSAWPAASHPSQAQQQVALDRVPRDKAAEILPRLLSGNAPLRDMLQQRSRAV